MTQTRFRAHFSVSLRHSSKPVMAELKSIAVLLLFSVLSIRAGSIHPRASVTNDFENGTTYPWFDNSPSDVHWVIEDFNNPLESTPAPQPNSGTKYLRAYRGASGTAFGLAVFSSPYFTALPGDNIYLNFWIRSDHTGGNSLEVYYALNGVEERILNLGIFSSPSNFEWRSASAALPITEPTDLRLVIYGYCGSVAQDAIAIDNIVVRRPADNSTTTISFDTTTTTTTQTTTTTTTTPTPSTTTETEIVTTSLITTTPATETSTPTAEITTTTTPTTTTTTPSSDPCSYTLTASSGQIYSPNYPSNYPANSSCTWLIKLQDPYKKIKFDFVDFVSETCCDVLWIYDGETEKSPLLLKHQGTFLPTPTSVTSTVPGVFLKFTSDFGIQHTGFWIEYSGVF